ncbi:MAG: hypothetical protein NT031_09310 [Planctomycetota bacterium]|nr:hypothetical protein [Planctomycetota bacterium]
MTQAVTVLKKAQVREAPRVQLGGSSASPEASAATGGAKPASTGPQPQARILEQDETAALVEVLCPCGCRIVLKCQTGSVASSGERTPSKERNP